MKRSLSEPRGNPFWSERAADEWLLAQLRPQALPETPSAVLPPVPPDQPNDWDERTEEDSPRPVKDQQRKGSPQAVLSEKRSGRGSASSSAFRTPRSWQRQDSGWVPKSQGAMPKEEVIRSEGPMEKAGLKEDRALEEALENEMVEQLVRENAALRQKLTEMQTSKTGSSWSEVTAGEHEASTPRRNGNVGFGKKSEMNRFTPGGTQVPTGPPPGMDENEVEDWVPPPPPLVPCFPDLSDYEKLEVTGGAAKMRFGSTPWHPTFQDSSSQNTCAHDIWMAVEELNARSEALRQLCLRDGRGHHDRALAELGDQRLQARVSALHGDQCHQDRVSALHGDQCHQDRASALCGGLLHQDRASALCGGLPHQDRAGTWSDLFPGRVGGQGLSHEQPKGQDQKGAVPAHQGSQEFQGGGTRIELPPLPTNLNPMDLGDWLTLISPLLRDISAQSARWWELTVQQAQMFYEQWRSSSPVQRVKIQPCLPGELLQPIYARTEQRGVGLLLRAMSEDIRKILISNRDMNSTSLVWRLLITFQPGGPGEKGQLLEDLTVMKPSSTASEVATSLRHWRRCFQRAQEIGTSLPDGTLLLRGLEGPTKTISQLDPQAAFRVAQSRSELSVDTTLTSSVLLQYSQVLLAEAETLQLVAATNAAGGSQTVTPKTKALQVPGNGNSSKPSTTTTNSCRFWGTPEGCKNGKSCRYAHPELQDKKDRCWNCSATSHRKSECPHLQNATSNKLDGGSGNGSSTTNPTSGSGGGGKGGKGGKSGAKAAKATAMSGGGQEDQAGGQKEPLKTSPSTAENPGKGSAVDNGSGKLGPPTTGETDLVSEVTASVKVCGLRKLHPGDQRSVLLDGGATHCLRTCKNNQEWDRAKDIEVALAEGSRMMKQCSSTKTLLTQEQVQPIIPVSLITSLGYQVQWNENGCRISHPGRQDLPVEMIQGCPTVRFDVGMKLFEEIEGQQKELCRVRAVLAGEDNSDNDLRLQQLRDLFPTVPVRILERLPGRKSWDPAALPLNRRRRRQVMRAKTLVFNVFSGPDEKQWLKQGKNGVVVVCLDILLNCNLHDGNMAGWIEEVIQSRGVDLWLAGPPCRTISLLRHKQDDGPKPLRGGREEFRFGLPGLNQQRQQQADDDSTLWLRNLWWMWLNKMHHPGAKNLIEQPQDPNEWYQGTGEKDLYPSFLRWPETRKVAEALGLTTTRLEQGALGHPTVKPTSLEAQPTNQWPVHLDERLQFSKSLAAWAPGLKAVLFKVIHRVAGGLEPMMKKLSSEELEEIRKWEAHVSQGHIPYRRDCAVCVEACGRDRPHNRRPTGEAFTMSLDIAGPYDTGIDQAVQRPRYFVTSVLTIPKVGDNPLVEGLREFGLQQASKEGAGCHVASGSVEDATRDGIGGWLEKKHEVLEGDDRPVIAAVQNGDPQPGELQQHEGGQNQDEPQQRDPFRSARERKDEDLTEAEVREMDQLNQQWAELIRDRPEVDVVHLAQSIPIASRKPKDVMAAVSLMYCRYRSLRIPILRVHSDRAKEFISKEFKAWCAARDLWRTTTSGSEPQANSRAEMEIGAVRNLARTMLKASGSSNTYWPLAVRCASEIRFRQQLADMGVMTPRILPFGVKAMARQKPWHRSTAWDAPNIPVRLWGPASDLSLTSGGYYAELEDGKFMRTTAIIVPKWRSQNGQILQPEPRQPVNPEAPIGDSPGLENPNEVRGLEEPGAGLGLLDHEDQDSSRNHPIHLQELQQEDPSLEVVQEVDIFLDEPSEGQQQTESTRHQPRRRLHRKTTPVSVGASTNPTLRRVARGVGGESEPLQELAEEMEVWNSWMLFQHINLAQLMQELVLDVGEGLQGGDETLQKVQREVRVLEGHLKKVNVEEEEVAREEVLQTRLISVQEVRQNMMEWKEPFQEEYDMLCSTVIKKLDPKALKEVLSSAEHVERIPSKIAPTIKPPFKRRGRIVACGNYAAAPEGDVSAGGIETICLRTLLRKTAHNQWSAATIDVKKAFLNAPRAEKKGHVTLIDPPAVLVTMGVIPKDESWLCTGAIYGLTQSPHDWGMHRDEMFRNFKWTCNNEELRLIETPERHLWKITKEGTQEERGYLCSYVDDLMVAGEQAVVESTIKRIEEQWACSEPEYINNEKNIRFCGYELRWDRADDLLLMQPSYVLDLLDKYQVKGREAEPCPKITQGENEDYTADTLRAAQQITGELLWVQTRTRPDLSYVVGAMSRWLHKRPGYVVQLGHHAMKYLAGTPYYGLRYGVCSPEDWDPEEELQTPPSFEQVDAFVDSSFSLEHEQYRSVTGVVLQQGGAPISWTSGRQPFIASSTTEAEILGYSESLQQAESLDMLLKVFNVNPRFNLYGDSKSALALSTGEGGPWRTRHLRLRAAKLRETLRTSREGRDGCDQPKWTARHLPGVKLVADGLTKALCGRSFVNFRSRLHMVDTRIEVEEKASINKVTLEKESNVGAAWWSKLAAAGALLVQLGKEWTIRLGALILMAIMKKKQENGEVGEMPKVRAYRPQGDPSRDQMPLRPPVDLENRRAREQARTLGTAHRELHRNFNLPQPHFRRDQFWWDSERFMSMPMGQDQWLQTQEGLVIRTHCKARRRSFHPLHRSLPVPVSDLRAVRYTVVFPDDNQSHFTDPRPRLVEHDEWSGTTQWTKDYRWKGFTIFVLKSCLLEEEVISSRPYDDEVHQAPRRADRQVYGGAQIHRDDNLPPGDLRAQGQREASGSAASSSGFGGHQRSEAAGVTVNVTVINQPIGATADGSPRPRNQNLEQSFGDGESEFEFVTP